MNCSYLFWARMVARLCMAAAGSPGPVKGREAPKCWQKHACTHGVEGCWWRCRNARAMGLHEVVVLGRSLMGKFGEEGESRPPPDAELWEKNVGALAEAFEAVRPVFPI